MNNEKHTGDLRTQARKPERRRFIHHLALLAGGALFAPLFARATVTASAAIPAPPKAGRIIVFPGYDVGALAAHLNTLGYGWMPVANQAAAHASASGGEAVAVIGTGEGVCAALRFARSHSNVKAVLVMGEDHGDAFEEFRTLQAPRAYAVQVLGAVDAVDWHGAGRWLDRHMA